VIWNLYDRRLQPVFGIIFLAVLGLIAAYVACFERGLLPRNRVPAKICGLLAEDRLSSATLLINQDYIVVDQTAEQVTDKRTGFRCSFLELIRLRRNCSESTTAQKELWSAIRLCDTVFVVGADTRV
jgi:hypothetical protein